LIQLKDSNFTHRKAPTVSAQSCRLPPRIQTTPQRNLPKNTEGPTLFEAAALPRTASKGRFGKYSGRSSIDWFSAVCCPAH
jgi:hypothetical protein